LSYLTVIYLILLKIQKFHTYVWYKLLPNKPNDKEEWKDEEWGCYPPERWYNMDQVPLPFVIDQNTTHAIDDEEHIHSQSPGADGLDKRQYTMHIFTNAGSGDTADGYIDMIARGKGTRISKQSREGCLE
jgi:hypothetical protein